MPKNVVEDSLHRVLQNTISSHRGQLRTGRTDQISPNGYFPLKSGTSTTVEVIATSPNGSMYYATDLGHIRAKIAGVWTTVV